MSQRSLPLSLAAFLALGALAVPAAAEEVGAVHGAKTVGALTLAAGGRATNAAEVLRQGGFATAGVADWSKAAAEHAPRALVAGAVTAGAVRWASAPAAE